MVLQGRLLHLFLVVIVSGFILSVVQGQHYTGLEKINENKTTVRTDQTPSSISGHIRLHLQGNIRPESETDQALSNWTVLLLDRNKRPLHRNKSDKDGQFIFKGLPSGKYYVAVKRARGYKPTFDVDGIQSKDIAAVRIAPGETKDFVNFGYAGTGTIDSYIWQDVNLNKIRDPRESGWEGVQLVLKHSKKGFKKTSTTDTEGDYRFEHLPPGQYSISVKEPEGYEAFDDEDGLQTPNHSTLEMGAGAVHQTADFGFIKEGKKETVPVKWKAFQVRNVENQKASLQWMTADESHCKYFEVERSTDQKNWNVISTVQADGRAEERTMYSYIDAKAPCQTVYYRIHQVDHNRSRGKTDAARVSLDCKQRIHSYPNPATSNVTVTIPNNLSPDNISVFAPDGSLQFSKTIPTANKNVYILSIDVEDWTEGTYYLSLQDRKNKVIGQKTFTVHR